VEEILDILEDSIKEVEARDGQNTIEGLLEDIIKIHTHLVEKSTHCMYPNKQHFGICKGNCVCVVKTQESKNLRISWCRSLDPRI